MSANAGNHRTPLLLLAAFGGFSGLLVGCGKPRTLSWSAHPGAATRLDGVKHVAVCNYVTFDRNVHAIDASRVELTNTIAGELLARGYLVTVLGEEEAVDRLITREVITASATTQPVARVERQKSLGGEEIDRFDAAGQANADLLFEFSTQATARMDMKMSIWAPPIPFVPAKTKAKMQWSCEIRQISLRISCPQERTILGTATVHYESPEDEMLDAVKDVCLGMDLIRQGTPANAVKLTGDAGVYEPE